MKEKFKTGLLLPAFLFLAASCATVSNISVNNVSDGNAPQTGTFLYSLPQTVFDINVEAEQVAVVPGPYARYASKYLGIRDVPVKPETIYRIRNISLDNHLEADPEFLYSVNGIIDPLTHAGLAGLIRDSMILKASDFSGRYSKSNSVSNT